MFAVTQVAFIETWVIKCKTLLGTADGVLAAAQAAPPSAAPPHLRPFVPRTGLGRGPRASGQRESSLLEAAQTCLPLLAPTETNKTAQRIRTGDLNPILSRVPEATN